MSYTGYPGRLKDIVHPGIVRDMAFPGRTIDMIHHKSMMEILL